MLLIKNFDIERFLSSAPTVAELQDEIQNKNGILNFQLFHKEKNIGPRRGHRFI